MAKYLDKEERDNMLVDILDRIQYRLPPKKWDFYELVCALGLEADFHKVRIQKAREYKKTEMDKND